MRVRSCICEYVCMHVAVCTGDYDFPVFGSLCASKRSISFYCIYLRKKDIHLRLCAQHTHQSFAWSSAAENEILSMLVVLILFPLQEADIQPAALSGSCCRTDSEIFSERSHVSLLLTNMFT